MRSTEAARPGSPKKSTGKHAFVAGVLVATALSAWPIPSEAQSALPYQPCSPKGATATGPDGVPLVCEDFNGVLLWIPKLGAAGSGTPTGGGGGGGGGSGGGGGGSGGGGGGSGGGGGGSEGGFPAVPGVPSLDGIGANLFVSLPGAGGGIYTIAPIPGLVRRPDKGEDPVTPPVVPPQDPPIASDPGQPIGTRPSQTTKKPRKTTKKRTPRVSPNAQFRIVLDGTMRDARSAFEETSTINATMITNQVRPGSFGGQAFGPTGNGTATSVLKRRGCGDVVYQSAARIRTVERFGDNVPGGTYGALAPLNFSEVILKFVIEVAKSEPQERDCGNTVKITDFAGQTMVWAVQFSDIGDRFINPVGQTKIVVTEKDLVAPIPGFTFTMTLTTTRLN